MKKTIILLSLVVGFLSCTKVEGEGGTSSISGKLIINDVNSSGELNATYPGADEDVFIIYGENNTTYNDKMSCSYDGSYRFDYLTTGTYQIFAYSDCDTCDSGTNAIFTTVEITDNKQEVIASDIVVYK